MKRLDIIIQLRFATACTIAFAWFSSIPVCWNSNAQVLTEVIIQPELSVVTIGDQLILTVDVFSGNNLGGYDLSLSYDPDVVELSSWTHGTYFSNLAVMKADLQPGLIHLAAVQVATPGVSGDGTILNLMFNAKSAGESDVVFESLELATSDGILVIPSTSNGLIVVNYPATETPTPTLSPTFTNSPTITLTPTPIRTYTPTRTYTPAAIYVNTQTSSVSETQTLTTYTPVSPTREFTFSPQLSSTEAEANDDSSSTAFPSVNDIGSPEPENPQSAAISTTGSSISQLNRLLWGFAILLIVALASFIFILLRHEKKH